MKILTLLFLMPLISFIDINAQISANNTYSAEASPKDNILVPSIGKSWKYPIITERLQKKIFSKINYRAQYAFEASSLPGLYPKSYAQVNLTYLNSILLDDGSFAYSTQRNMSVDETKMAKNTLKMDENKMSQANMVIDTYKLNNNHQILKQKVRE